MTRFHFIAGMPRSGSTLLSAILRQNPDIHASITSPVANLYERLYQEMGVNSTYSGRIDDSTRVNVLRGLFKSYYAETNKLAIFDTNRSWCARMGALNLLFPHGKIIACVRDPVWVLDSFERLHQKNPLLLSKQFDRDVHTLHQRVESMAAASGSVGFAYDAVAEAYYGSFRHNLIIVDYKELCSDPAIAVDHIYRKLNLPPFQHDFDNVEQIPGHEAHDRRYGLPGMHTIRRKVEWVERASVLPPDLFKRFANKSFW